MMKARFHINKVEIADSIKESFSPLLDISNVTTISFSQNGQYCAMAIIPKSIIIWDISSVIYPMLLLNEAYFPNDTSIDCENWFCLNISWSWDHHFICCIFQMKTSTDSMTSNDCNSGSIVIVYDILKSKIIHSFK